jgi:Ca2+-binding EF-hand superfamily protein
MKASKRLAGAVAMTMVGSVAKAQAPPAKPNAAETEFKSMDKNGDGKISADEHAAGAKRMFDTMDANQDGQVSPAEMDAAHERITGRKVAPGDMSAADKIKVIDGNSDGVLAANEHAAGSKKMFEEMDTNRDGFVTLGELIAGHAKMMGKQKEKR